MADSSTPSPSKPKPGSLRDRIAAFEKSSAAATATPERAPVRPKGSNISWKPSVSSPDNASGDGEKKPAFGANDAKESIKSGGSLKERMAALQGKGGMGGASPLTPPTPQSVKPVRAPPPGLSPSSKEELESPKETGTEESEKDRTASEGRETTATEGAEEKEKPEATAEVEEDEEANERERRAAIAARMARLGGTKIGFAAPPVFGRKPNRSKSTEEVSAESRGTSVDDTGVIPSESKELDTTVSKDITGILHFLISVILTDHGSPIQVMLPSLRKLHALLWLNLPPLSQLNNQYPPNPRCLPLVPSLLPCLYLHFRVVQLPRVVEVLKVRNRMQKTGRSLRQPPIFLPSLLRTNNPQRERKGKFLFKNQRNCYRLQRLQYPQKPQ